MIYQKISEIMKKLVEIGKIKREDIVPTMLPLLAEKNIVIRPIEIENYKFIENQSSFVATYELIDTEDYTNNKNKNSEEKSNYESIIVKLPAGGSDQEAKGRATYMASTGVYRQILQQIFAIPLFEPDEDVLNNPAGNQVVSDTEKSLAETFDEFEQDTTLLPTQEETIAKPVEEMTDADIDTQFANF